MPLYLCTMGGSTSTFSLYEAVILGKTKTVRKLLKTEHDDINELLGPEGKTMLFSAVSMGNKEIAAALLHHGADANVIMSVEDHNEKYVKGEAFTMLFAWSAIHEACMMASCDLLRLLLEHGGNVDLAACNQMTPLHVAAWRGDAAVVQVLVDSGCDVNRLDESRESALVIPFQCGDVETVRTLLLAGCRTNSSCTNGAGINKTAPSLYRTPGQHSLYTQAISPSHSQFEMAVILLQHGWNANCYPIPNVVSDIQPVSETRTTLLECYIAAGYRFTENDHWLLDQLPPTDDCTEGVIHWLQDCASRCPTLKQAARNIIREHIRICQDYRSVLPAVQKLPLPPVLVSYLSLEEFSNLSQGMTRRRFLSLFPRAVEMVLEGDGSWILQNTYGRHLGARVF